LIEPNLNVRKAVHNEALALRISVMGALLCFFWMLPNCLSGQVTANFSGSPLSGCAPLTVNFTNLSTGGDTSWVWDLGNGSTSTLENPGTTYTNPGTYTVTLIVQGPGGPDTLVMPNYVTVFAPPTAIIGASQVAGCTPLSVQFTSLSTASSAINTYLWDFGDGFISNAQNPPHTYAAAGVYNVLLQVVDANTCSNVTPIPTTITVQPPVVANFSANPASGCQAPLTVNFTDASTGPGPFTYAWTFGDGGTSTLQNPVHNYAATGTYTVTLSIANGNGCTDTLVQNNLIVVSSLNAAFSAAPTSVCQGSAVAFSDLSTGSPTSWQWDFGDGNTSNAQNPSHAYAAPGTYTVQLIVNRAPGCPDTIIQTNLITVLPLPTAAFSGANTTSCAAPLTTTFTDNSVGAVAWAWNFGDPASGGLNTSNAQNPPHTYNNPGSYNVTLTVTGANGCTNTLTQPNFVQIVPPVANFTFGTPNGCRPHQVIFTDASTTTLGVINAWFWDFGDGANSSNPTHPHTYSAAGTYTVTLTVTTDLGCTATIVMPNLVHVGDNPNADFSGTPQSVCAGQPVAFTDLSTGATAWLWDFGDGGGSIQQNPTHAYTNIGCFDVTLTADNNGCQDVETKPNYICVVGTDAAFTRTPFPACDTPATITFTNTSTGIPAQIKTLWRFGDGTTATTFHATHTYATTGGFIVTLISNDTVNNCIDSVSHPVTISKPNAAFTMANDTGCATLNTVFTNTSTNAFPPTTYAWTFGDGGTSTQLNPTHAYTVGGTHTPRLIVRDVFGCRDTAFAANPVLVNDVAPALNAAPRNTCRNTLIQFTDNSTTNSSVVAWLWNFGDGNTSTLQNPTHSYAATGNYNVSLQVTDSNGCSRTRTRVNFIQITKPTPNFALSDTLLCPGDLLQLGTTASGTPLLTYQWTFGDGGTSTANNPSHSYATNGNYPIQQVVTDGNGCSDSITKIMKIQRPVANFTIDDSISSCPPLIAAFHNTSSGQYTSWTWDFGDGTLPVNGNMNPSHIYNSIGSFTVTLIVRTATGCADTLAIPGRAVVNGPTGTYAFDKDTTCPGQPVVFTLTASDPTLSVTVDFRDGAVLNGYVISHAYAAAGSYRPTVVVTDTLGCPTNITVPDTILVLPTPIANFGYSDTLLCSADSVVFSDSTVFGGGPSSFLWNFGDGGTSNLQNPHHFYAGPGTYNVSLTVNDTLGCTDIQTVPKAIRIFNYQAGFTAAPQYVCKLQDITFADTSLSDTTIVNWQWDFGDLATALGDTVQHNYIDTGWYNVQLVITTLTGCTDTALVPNAVHVEQPVGTFSFSPDTTCPGQTVQFIFSGGLGVVPMWYFGDGDSLAGGDTVTHQYLAAGSYTPVVVMTDSLGCTDSAATAGQIVVLPVPIAQLSFFDTLLCLPDTVAFGDSTLYGGNPATWAWNFGDGGTDTVQHPNHYFAQPGTYTVSLFVNDALGCSDGDTVVAAVRVFRYQAGFTAAPQYVCKLQDITFADTSRSDTTIVNWQWDFGDLGTALGDTVFHNYTDTGWYNVQLIITTLIGCSDTVVVPNAVHVEEPVGTFIFSPDTTCPGQTMQFIFSGGLGVVPMWYFGDGDSLAGGDTVTHQYLSAGNFTPIVVMTDTLGCSDTAATAGQVVVLPGPQASFAHDSTVFCLPDSVHFWNTSTSSSGFASINWSFGDGGFGVGSPIAHWYAQPSINTVTLIVTDGLGCSDTASQVATVVIHGQRAAFFSDVQSGCVPTNIQFTDSSFADTTIVAWNWDFGDGSASSAQNPSHAYSTIGSFDVTLVITTILGCRDTIVLPGYINTIPPDVPQIWAASVEDDNTVSVTMHADTSALFDFYSLYQQLPGNTFTLLDTHQIQADTLFYDGGRNTPQNVYCYGATITDVCGNVAGVDTTDIHCTIDLTAMPATDQVLLSWTPYQGWDSILRYDVFSVNDYDTSQVYYLSSVAGNVNIYLDTNITCPRLRAYRVRAVGSFAQQRSWSDTSSAIPNHFAPGQTPEMVTATVINNADIEVDWLPAPFAPGGTFDVQRSTDGINFASVGILPPSTVQYIDQTANVGALSYYYQVLASDSCGYWSAPSNHSRSILLQIDASDGTAHLNWNAYSQWANGVLQYELEAQPFDGGNWTHVATLPDSVLSYHDVVGVIGHEGACYRVTATEAAGGNDATSRSNEVCNPGTLWIPNTVTPNGDGSNDVWVIQALASFPGSGVHVYNRWGNLVYESADYQNDWRGTNGNTGAILPDGTYFYILFVSDGRVLKGYVTILR
jgi:gliding motility-associated-like protein